MFILLSQAAALDHYCLNMIKMCRLRSAFSRRTLAPSYERGVYVAALQRAVISCRAPLASRSFAGFVNRATTQFEEEIPGDA